METKLSLKLTWMVILILATLVAALVPGHKIQAASLVEITNFGSNPGAQRMYLYVPDNVAAQPAILVAMHGCGGSGSGFYSSSEFATLANRYGFIVIYPSATRFSNCFDISSPEALRHDGGSDPVSIVSMVRYVVQNYRADASRVYATGSSSGAMETIILLGTYPDVFKAGAAFMGVPFGCMAGLGSSPTPGGNVCANGTNIKTPQAWGDLVRAAYPGYTGPRPRLQVWHGTQDTVLAYPNFGEEIKQWTNVMGVSQTASFTDQPQSTWTRTRYGGTGVQSPIEAISIQGAGHSLPQSGMAALAVAFLGLDSTSSATATPTRTNTPIGPTPTRTNTPVSSGDGSPYNGTAVSLPGTVQAENFNTGGQNVAYNDTTTGNSGNAYRTSDNVDIETTTDTGGGYNVGWTVAGEWLKYTVNVQTSGSYTLTFRVASQQAGGSFHLEVDGVNVTGAMAMPNTGGWQTYTTVTKTGVNLTAGQRVLRLVLDGSNGNFNWFSVSGGTAPTNTPVTPTSAVPTNTSVASTRTNTPVVVPSNTTIAPTVTPSGNTCSPVNATITAPFTFDGAGTLCWRINNVPNFINSWNTTSVTVNGVNFTNLWAGPGQLPAKASDGYWYISYNSSVSWGHFEAK